LLWYNGNPGVVDAEGRNAYYYAHCSLHKDCANFLHRSGCPRQPVPPVLPAPQLTLQQQRHSAGGTSKSISSGLVPVNPMATPKHHQQHSMIPMLSGSGHCGQTLQPQQLSQGPIISGVVAPSPGYSNMYLHNMVPVSSQPGMHGTMSSAGGVNMIPSHITPGSSASAAGATLPRRRGPLASNQVQSVFLPSPHPVYNNVSLQQQQISTTGRPNPNYILGHPDNVMNRPLQAGVSPSSVTPPVVSPLSSSATNHKTRDSPGASEIGV